eukprot:3932528-Rhodomonas_salina.1
MRPRNAFADRVRGGVRLLCSLRPPFGPGRPDSDREGAVCTLLHPVFFASHTCQTAAHQA